MTQPLHHLITSTKFALLIERKLTTLLCFWVVPFRRICTQLPSAGLSWIMPDQFLTSTTNNSLHHGKVAHVNKHVIQQQHQLNQTWCHKTYICIVFKNQHRLCEGCYTFSWAGPNRSPDVLDDLSLEFAATCTLAHQVSLQTWEGKQSIIESLPEGKACS